MFVLVNYFAVQISIIKGIQKLEKRFVFIKLTKLLDIKLRNFSGWDKNLNKR